MVLVSPGSAVATRWWLVHTKPRHEKALAADLGRKGVDHFLPLIRVKRRRAGRVSDVRLPLFPGYLFLSGTEEARCAALMTSRTVNVIRVADQGALERDLQEVYRLTVSDEPVDLYPGVRRGRRCRVVGGPLKGLEGVVLRRRDMSRVYVAVHALLQSAEVEIDVSLLEPI